MIDVFLFCLVLVGLAAFVAAPLYRPSSALPSDANDGAVLAARRQAALSALRDLEVDHASGLVDDATYAMERGPLEVEAADLRDGRAPPAD